MFTISSLGLRPVHQFFEFSLHVRNQLFMCAPSVLHVSTISSPRVYHHSLHVHLYLCTLTPGPSLLRGPSVLRVLFACPPSVLHMSTISSSHIHHQFFTCPPSVLHMSTISSSHVHHQLFTCPLSVLHVSTISFFTCAPSIALMQVFPKSIVLTTKPRCDG